MTMTSVLSAAVGLVFTAAASGGLDTAKIEALTGLKGKLDAKEGVFKVSMPRSDLKVTAAGVHLSPALGLTTWAAFKKVDDHTVVMGDQVLTEDQVNPVMSVALENGLAVTALHNHFFWDSPRVMFMHLSGMGDEAKLAEAVGKVIAKTRETSGGKGLVPMVSIDPTKGTLDSKKVDAVLGEPGDLKDGVYKVTFGRTTQMGGHEMGSAMGVNTWAAFAGADDKAVVDGDFAVLESELQAVLKALRAGGINIVAIHSHMTNENPRTLFLHFWGVGATHELASTLKSALQQTTSSSH
jgi:hypothetical protein